MTDSPTRPFAVITSASSGIGYAFARRFAEHGYDLLITADGPEIEETARSLLKLGGRIVPLQADLATREGVEALYEAILSEKRSVESLVLNAGLGPNAQSGQFDLESHLRLIALSITSMVHLAKLVAADMTRKRRGRILFVCSPGDPASSLLSTWMAAKAFLISFAAALRYELADKGIVVSTLTPEATDDPDDLAREGLEALMTDRNNVVSIRAKMHAEQSLSEQP